ncbi:MAG: type II secretion system F family protein, partial [Candidatus Hydrogenedentes bacterium]|nr:type II secretion system F family protein [Candidatus Hydrogenedentota bacterium]
ARETCTNNLYKTAVSKMISGVLRGESFSENFSKSPLFTPSTKQMIATGDRTGSLPLVMDKMANYLDRDSQIQMKKLSALVEPLVIICMGVVVGFIAVSILLPLFRLTSAVKPGG